MFVLTDPLLLNAHLMAPQLLALPVSTSGCINTMAESDCSRNGGSLCGQIQRV